MKSLIKKGDKPALAPGNRWPGLQPDDSQLPEEDNDDNDDEGDDEKVLLEENHGDDNHGASSK